MKFSYLIFVLLFVFSCQDGAKEDGANTASNETTKDKDTSKVENGKEDQKLPQPPPKQKIAEGTLICKFLGETEFGVPQNTVSVVVNGLEEQVGKCNSCQTITKKEYKDYEIPSNALSACGGWWAGAGDYYYAVKNKNGGIDVYAGWQDEGQLDEDDLSYHWKRSKSYK